MTDFFMVKLKLFVLLSIATMVVSACPEEPQDNPDVVIEDAGEEAFCPTRLRFTTLAGALTHVGSTGGAHNASFPEGEVFLADVTQCDDECRNCRFEGPVDEDLPWKHERCLADTAIECGDGTACPNYECQPVTVAPDTVVNLCANNLQPCGTSADCEESACLYMVGATQASTASPSCFATVFARQADGSPPFEGVIDLFTGQINFQNWNLLVASANRAGGYCETCEGDDIRGDGVKNGTCSNDNTLQPKRSAILGDIEPDRPCDVHGAASFSELAGRYSNDCSVPLAVVFGLPVENYSSSAARRWTLEEGDQPVCGENGELCWCGVCEGTTEACHSQSDCSQGACVASFDQAAGVATRNNLCIDECSWSNQTLTGSCTAVIGGTPEAPVIAQNWPCFPSSGEISVSGDTEILSERSYSIRVSDLSCTDQGAFAATNGALGLPGPTLGQTRFRIDLE